MYLSWRDNYPSVANGSTSPAFGQSRPCPSKSSPIQWDEFLNRDRTNPHFIWIWTELAWADLDQSSTVSRFRVFFHCIGLWMGGIYLDGTKYTVRTVIFSPAVGIQRCAVINVRMSHVFSGTWLRNNVEIASVRGLDQTKPVQSQTGSVWTGGIIECCAVFTPANQWSYTPNSWDRDGNCSDMRSLSAHPQCWEYGDRPKANSSKEKNFGREEEYEFGVSSGARIFDRSRQCDNSSQRFLFWR